MDNKETSFRLADLTADAVASQAGRDLAVILLPLGSHEDHGPHLPMGDFILADILAERIARAASASGVRTLVAPCLPFGVADYFGSSAGGLAITAATFRALLDDVTACLLRHGLTKVILLNGHGGNVPVIHEVTLKIRRENGLILPSIYLWRLARELMEREIGPGQNGRFGHAAEPLLSLSMALRNHEPGSSRPAEPAPESLLGLPVNGFGTVRFLDWYIEVPAEFDQVPRPATAAARPLASAELGNQVADELVRIAAAFVLHYNSVANISGVSKSCSTPSDSTGSSATNSR